MKLNNKGFAISTLIYGLSIMGIMLIAILMGIMAVNRTNNRLLSDQIEEDLTKHSQTDTSYSASTTERTFTVPVGEAGWYKIELWGAGGAGGGRGAYTYGVIELEEEDALYFNVGRKTSTNGEATDVRLISKNKGASVSIPSRIMVAAGAGSGANANGGTLIGYSSSIVPRDGKLNIDSNYNLTTDSKTLVGYASYPDQPPYYDTAAFTTPLESPSSGGGGGFTSSKVSGYGGTSFIAGYAGCQGFNANTGARINDPGVIYKTDVYNEETGDVTQVDKNYHFVDGMMFAGVNSGHGKAKIEKVARKTDPTKKLVRLNHKLDNVVKIKDCVSGASDAVATKIVAVSGGKIISTGSLYSDGDKCVSINVNGSDLDEIAVWHKPGKDYTKHKITVIRPHVGEITLKNATDAVPLSETETAVGYRVSAYQPDSVDYLPKSGNYYILPVLSENKVLTAQDTAENAFKPIMVEYLNGYKRQKWSIEVITDKRVSPGYVSTNKGTYEYKIIELARFRSLSIYNDENKEQNEITAATEFNASSRNEAEIWKITPMGNGTYTIKTVAPKFKQSVETGNIFPQLDTTKMKKNEILIGKINNQTERFRLISIDYSSA